ncbi:alpha/beta hydrolase family protein [Lewinella cohaerens]|uniref:alpha/beta hydrolase family protein n=1 Tax=Lewinella cohaerens TaxID=70995 RepID=UPI000372B362|nr:alpha/beta fold hydrolase [Lewinella cohaerens]
METRSIYYRDGSSNEASVFTAPSAAKAIIICLPAMGVRASYYRDFAQALSEQAFHVVTIDWRGHGQSNLRAGRTIDFGYEELVEDLSELLDYTENWFSVMPVYIVGHSLGGQIASLCTARYPGLIQGLILIASCSVYYEGWEEKGAWRVWLAAKLFHPLSKVVGHFPGKVIGFGGREARKVMHDWCYNGLYGKYRLAGSPFDYEAALAKMETPSLAISIRSDEMAPRKAMDNLVGKFAPTAERRHLELSDNPQNANPYNHFNWAKQPKKVVQQIVSWIP